MATGRGHQASPFAIRLNRRPLMAHPKMPTAMPARPMTPVCPGCPAGAANWKDDLSGSPAPADARDHIGAGTAPAPTAVETESMPMSGLSEPDHAGDPGVGPARPGAEGASRPSGKACRERVRRASRSPSSAKAACRRSAPSCTTATSARSARTRRTTSCPRPMVSRFHCRLVREEGVWRLRDSGSMNGTKLEGVRVRDADLTDGGVLHHRRLRRPPSRRRGPEGRHRPDAAVVRRARRQYRCRCAASSVSSTRSPRATSTSSSKARAARARSSSPPRSCSAVHGRTNRSSSSTAAPSALAHRERALRSYPRRVHGRRSRPHGRLRSSRRRTVFLNELR